MLCPAVGVAGEKVKAAVGAKLAGDDGLRQLFNGMVIRINSSGRAIDSLFFISHLPEGLN